MIKEAYEKLKKKHSALPDFDDINHEFEIESIEKEFFLLRNIRRVIADKLEVLMNSLAHVLQPESISICEFYEFRCFDAEKKAVLFNLFKQLRFNYLKLVKLDIILDDGRDAEAIRDVLKFWKDFKPKMVPYFDVIGECWEKEYDEKEILGYLG